HDASPVSFYMTPPSELPLPRPAAQVRHRAASFKLSSAEDRTTRTLSAAQTQSGRGLSAMASVTCRVQFLEDSDPFICTNFPEPRRPPTVTLEEDQPLSEQITVIHKLLGAPLKVGQTPNRTRTELRLILESEMMWFCA
ncbi:hypothetical protein GOODEAATRI_026760, partial [Goodea atripinnis]